MCDERLGSNDREGEPSAAKNIGIIMVVQKVPMAVYKEERIVGVHRGKEIICAACMSEDDWMSLTKDNMLIERQVEKEAGLYCCDSCGETIRAHSRARG